MDKLFTLTGAPDNIYSAIVCLQPNKSNQNLSECFGCSHSWKCFKPLKSTHCFSFCVLLVVLILVCYVNLLMNCTNYNFSFSLSL